MINNNNDRQKPTYKNQNFDSYLQGCNTFKTLLQLKTILSIYSNQQLTDEQVKSFLRRHGIRIHYSRYVCWEKLEQAMPKERR